MAKLAVEKIRDLQIWSTVNLERYSESVRRKVIGILNDTQDDILSELMKQDTKVPITEWKKGRLTNLQKTIDGIADKSYGKIKRITNKDLNSITSFTAKETVGNLNKVIGAEIANVTLTPEGLKSIVSNTMIDGQVIGKWWDEQKDDFKRKAARQMADATHAVQLGLVKGEGINELVRRIRGTALAPGIMDMSKRNATSLVRTSVMQVANEARMDMYEGNKDLIDGYEFVATLDKRTSTICRAYDGKQWIEVDGKLRAKGHRLVFRRPPLHFQCRSTIIPILKSFADLVGTKGDISTNSKDFIKGYTAKGGVLESKFGSGLQYRDEFVGEARRKLPRHEGLVHRGVTVSEAEWEKMFNKGYVDKGNTISFDRLTSFTTDKPRAGAYGTGKDQWIFYHVNTKKIGTVDISPYSIYPQEQELLMFGKSKIKVKSWDYVRGSVHIYADEIGEKFISPKPFLSADKIRKLEKLSPTQRASMTYDEKLLGIGKPVSGGMTYNDWLLTQPEAVAIDVLGPGRFRLWKKHKLSMADMVNQKGRPLSIADLEKRFVEEVVVEKPVGVVFSSEKNQILYNKYMEEYGKWDAEKFKAEFRGETGYSIYNKLDDWQGGSQRPLPLALKLKASQVEKLAPLRASGAISKSKWEEIVKLADKIDDESYIKLRAITQAYYRKLGKTKIKLFRGIGGKHGKLMVREIRKLPKGSSFMIEEDALVGYTNSKSIAEWWGPIKNRGIAIGREVDVRDILVSDDVWYKEAYFKEHEFIVKGGRYEVSLLDIILGK